MARVFSGVQPTGNLHLGNYLGAIRNFVPLQASKHIGQSDRRQKMLGHHFCHDGDRHIKL